ncbi:hypothetical protein BD311DRAFT_700421 [Dichomitus squalens]|uniref:ZZ-type domain-containing protein n=1 Tax=Dichomitus squalens TaxID=114155 RepID=A0A4Q9MD97_9APHY|nr:hypothetical protein BD311DRAFT_700421 [Dichomitus squalens]
MAAFTVKATYRSETRKFSLPDSTFPTYDQLYSQLYRVFPISHSFYLSKLLFTPSPTSNARILIGKEVHSPEEYDRHVAPYRGGSWHGALLRFSVFDETPHKSSTVSPSDTLHDPFPSTPSSHSVASATTASTGASSPTVVGPAADSRLHLRGRQELVDRIRGHMNNRLSLHTMPPTPPASSRPTSMAESSSRPTSLASEPDGWRPLPIRPPSRGESAASTASVRTARPSLFDLLANAPSTQSVPRAVGTQPGADSDIVDLSSDNETISRHRDIRSRVDSTWKNDRPVSDALVLDDRSPSPRRPSIDDLSLPPRPHTFVAPPPPILFSRSSMSSLRAERGIAQTDGHVHKPAPTPRCAVTPPITLRTEAAQFAAQSAQPPQSESGERAKESRRRGRLTRMFMDETSPLLPKSKDEPCCSVSEAKAEVKVLMEKFKNDYERVMVKAFGEGWDRDNKASPKMEEAPLPRLPSPPTHLPVMPDLVNPRKAPRLNYYPPPLPVLPRRSLYSPPPLPPPPPPFVHSRPSLSSPSLPTLLPSSSSSSSWQRALPPPPPPCIIPSLPPPPPPFIRATPTVHVQVSPKAEQSSMSPSSTISTPPLPPPPPNWIPSVAFNPTQDASQRNDVRPEIGREGRDNEETVHKNVRCDFCGRRDIRGIRYKCLQCPDFDWCSTCMASPEAWEAHAATHPFFPIHRKEDFLHFCYVKDRRDRRQLAHNGITCDGCQEKNIRGVRHKCLQCQDYDLCDKCVSSPKTRQGHDVTHVFFPIETPGDKDAYNKARKEASQPANAALSPATHVRVHCDGCEQYPIVGVRHKCLDCDDFDFCTSCISDPTKREEHDPSHSFFPMDKPSDYSKFDRIRANHRRTTVEPLRNDSGSAHVQTGGRLLHKNVFCDVCTVEIVGVRHKCLDCPDYDMCDECISTPHLREQHHAQHQFFAIEKPGEVVVHTVFSGDGEREPPRPAPVTPRVNIPRSEDVEPVVHNAMCDMCDSRIRGDRFKCLNCPDYDVCQSCYKITPEQHPDHGFVKISEPATLMIRNSANDPIHYASCNVCGSQIRGVRYKCVHESCDDFDLCQNCEAHPISVHPVHHPLLKLKTPGAVIPLVLRTQNVPPMPMNPSSPIRTPSPYGVDYAETPVPREPKVIDMESSFTNAPAHPPALPLPEFTPDLEVPVLPQVTPPTVENPSPRPYRRSLNPFSRFEHPSPESIMFASFPRHMSPMRPTPPSPERLASPPPLSPISDVDFAPPRSPSPPRLVPVRSWEDMFGRAVPVVEIASVMPQFAQLVNLDDSIRATSPEPMPFLDERAQASADSEPSATAEHNDAEGTLEGISTPSDVTTSSASSKSVPKLGLVNSEWRELWPEMTSMFKHLLPPSPAEPSSTADPSPGNGFAISNAITNEPRSLEELNGPVVEESPLVGEPLLCRPLMPERSENRFTARRSLSDLINSMSPTVVAIPRVPSPESPISSPPSPVQDQVSLPPPTVPTSPVVAPIVSPFWDAIARLNPPLLAAFVSDSNIPVGQVFPPGAEFVKSWRMRNDGAVDWPETTELVFVAGDRMAPYTGAPTKFKIGTVKAGEEVELVSGEMKAPEVPGKYVSSWRLSDGNGNLFGQSVWVDITVAEMNEPSSDESLAASSVIMPRTAGQTVSARSSIEHQFSTSSMTVPSAPPSEIDSSVSLLDVSSSSSSDDEDYAVYEDSRSQFVPSPAADAQDVEYVMLFDSSSEDD